MFIQTTFDREKKEKGTRERSEQILRDDQKPQKIINN